MNRKFLNKIICALVVVLIVSNLNESLAQSGDINHIFNQINREIKAKYAPDSRDKTYDIRLVAEPQLTLIGSTTEADAKNELIRRVEELGIKAVDKIRLLPDMEALKGRDYGVVCMSVASFNSDPSFSAESGTQALAGMPVRILERSNGWYRCINMEGYTAWVITTSVSPMNKEEYDAYLSQPKVIITSPYTFMYSSANENSLKVSDLVLGDILVNDELTKTNNPSGSDAIYNDFINNTFERNLENGFNGSAKRNSLKKVSGWTRVHLTDGRAGYIKNSDYKDFDKWLSNAKPTEKNIVETAKQFTGWPYVWGGTSIKGIDCSGLAKTVYFLNGYVLRRDASQQCKTGDDIDISAYISGDYTLENLKNLRPGDLLFFGRKATENRPQRITHVGIYMGNGMMIHSSNVVRINSLIPGEKNYYSGSTNMLIARRIIGTADRGKDVFSVKKAMTNK